MRLEHRIECPVKRREIADRKDTGSVGVVARDRAAIHAEHQRLAHAHVVERRPLHVEDDRGVRRRGDELAPDTGGAPDVAIDRRGNFDRQVRFVRAELRRRRVIVGNDQQGELFERRRASKVRRVRTQEDPVAALPAHERVWPGTYRRGVERYVIEICVFCKQVLRKNAVRGIALGEDRIHGRREDPFQMHDDRVVVGRCHRSDLVVAAARHDVVARVHDRLPGEFYVATRKGRAILPFHSVPQVVRDRQPVFADSSVLKGGHERGKVGNLVMILIVRDQQIEDEPVGETLDRVLRENRIELRRIDVDRDAQAAGRPGVAAGTFRAARDERGEDRDADERGEAHQATQRNFAYMYG